jgi:hypothetical protein
VLGDLGRLQVAVGDVALDRLDEQRAGGVDFDDLRVEQAATLAGVDDVAGPDRAAACPDDLAVAGQTGIVDVDEGVIRTTAAICEVAGLGCGKPGGWSREKPGGAWGRGRRMGDENRGLHNHQARLRWGRPRAAIMSSVFAGTRFPGSPP